MKRVFLFFTSLFIPKDASVRDPAVRARYGVLEGWISIVGNMILFGAKLYAGILVKSTALIADAFHTLSDSATSAVVIIGFKLSQKPSDKEHPFGHGRVESVATVIISVLLFVAGFELLKTSVYAIRHPSQATASIPVILMVIGTVIVKQLMARFSFVIGEHIDSAALKADALHHQSDALSTILVLVALAASRYGYYSLDGVMGCLVSVAIFISAYQIMKDAVNPLLGEAPSQEFIDMIETQCKAISGVLGVHDIISHTYGQTRITSLHIEVCAREKALALHRLAEEVEDEIGQVTHGQVVVHIDPVNRDHPDYGRIKTCLELIVSENKKTDSFHDLRIVGDDSGPATAIFDIVTREAVPESENAEIVGEIRAAFSEAFPHLKTVIKTAPKYSYKP